MKTEIIYEIANFFELGDIKSAIKSDFGYGAHTLFLTNLEGQEFVIKIFSKVQRKRVENSISIAEQLSKYGLSSIHYLSRQGVYIYGDSLMAVASTKIRGEHLTDETPDKSSIVYSLGKSMAFYHKFVTSVPHDVSSDLLDPRVIKDTLIDHNDELIGSFIKVQSCIMSSELPIGVIHGDLYRYNFLISGKDELHILDLDSSRNAPYVLDIGRSIADVCATTNNMIDPVLVTKFLEGYQSVRPLSDIEKAAIIPATIYGAIAVMVWAIIRKNVILENQFRAIASSCKLD